MVLEHLSERISSAHSLEVVEGDLARDTLPLDHTNITRSRLCNDLHILLSRCWMFRNRLALSYITLLFGWTTFRRTGPRVGKLIRHGRRHLFGHCATRICRFLAWDYNTLVAIWGLSCVHHSLIVATLGPRRRVGVCLIVVQRRRRTISDKMITFDWWQGAWPSPVNRYVFSLNLCQVILDSLMSTELLLELILV